MTSVGFAGPIDDLKDMVNEGAIVEAQLPIWGETVEQFGRSRFDEFLGIGHWLALRNQLVSC